MDGTPCRQGGTLPTARAASRLPKRRVDVLVSLCGFAATPTVLTYYQNIARELAGPPA